MAAAKPIDATAVDRALGILELAAEHRGGLSNSEISRALGIPKSSASYILRALERRGYLRREPASGKYRPGLKVLSLGRDVLAGFGLAEMATPALRGLVERTQLTAHLAVLDHGEAVYIAKVDAPGFIKMDTWVGRRMYVHSTSVGKALVAYLPREEAEAIVRERGLKKRTPRTITRASRFYNDLEKVRARGYAMDDEENSVGVRCLAVPILGAQGKAEAALGLSGTTLEMEHSTIPRLAELLKDAARKLARQLATQVTAVATL